MKDKLKAIALCLLVIAALIVASAFVPVDSQYADNPYPGVETPEPYPIIVSPDSTPEKTNRTKDTKEFAEIEGVELKR